MISTLKCKLCKNLSQDLSQISLWNLSGIQVSQKGKSECFHYWYLCHHHNHCHCYSCLHCLAIEKLPQFNNCGNFLSLIIFTFPFERISSMQLLVPSKLEHIMMNNKTWVQQSFTKIIWEKSKISKDNSCHEWSGLICSYITSSHLHIQTILVHLLIVVSGLKCGMWHLLNTSKMTAFFLTGRRMFHIIQRALQKE